MLSFLNIGSVNQLIPHQPKTKLSKSKLFNKFNTTNLLYFINDLLMKFLIYQIRQNPASSAGLNLETLHTVLSETNHN